MLIFVTALAAEARPLIRFYKLKLLADSSFCQIYKRDNISLIITGVGKLACVAACAYFQGMFRSDNAVWINVGIAGHGSLNVGTGVWANKIIDKSCDTNCYPLFTTRPKLPTMTVCTVERPEVIFSDASVYEMEASGFFSIASKCSSAELIHVFKVISDNKNEKILFRSPEIENILEPCLKEIDDFSSSLLKVKKILPQNDHPTPEVFLDRWHFTETEKHQLKHLLSSYQVIYKKAFCPTSLDETKKGKDVIRALEKIVQSTPLKI